MRQVNCAPSLGLFTQEKRANRVVTLTNREIALLSDARCA
jgi:hypothetical protein